MVRNPVAFAVRDRNEHNFRPLPENPLITISSFMTGLQEVTTFFVACTGRRGITGSSDVIFEAALSMQEGSKLSVKPENFSLCLEKELG